VPTQEACGELLPPTAESNSEAQAMHEGFDRLGHVGSAAARPTRAVLIGLLIGTGLALIAALGPLVSAVTITVGVETQVGDASGLPDARMLPAALEGVGAVALIFLLTRRPAGRLRAWSVALIFVSLAAGMAAQGAHAIWYDEGQHHLELPWNVKLWVSFVPPISGLATLHLVVKMAEDLIGTIRLLVTGPPPAARATRAADAEAGGHSQASSELVSQNGWRRPGPPGAQPDTKVLRIVRANPRTTWRVVKDRTGLTEASAKRALTAARKRLRTTSPDTQEPEALDARPAHANGRSI
jgi:hypothetical protein